MKIIVLAKASAKEDKVERLTQPTLNFGDVKSELDVYKVSVKAQPVHGKSNEAIIRLLAEHFKVTQSQVKLISGRSTKRKFFDIDN